MPPNMPEIVLSLFFRLFFQLSGCLLKRVSAPSIDVGRMWSISQPYSQQLPYSERFIRDPNVSRRHTAGSKPGIQSPFAQTALISESLRNAKSLSYIPSTPHTRDSTIQLFALVGWGYIRTGSEANAIRKCMICANLRRVSQSCS